MKTFHFQRDKYGKELLMDLGQFEETPNFFFTEEPHTVDFYEIFFFRKAKGTLQLDNQILYLQNMQVVFASPYQRRIWNVQREDIQGYFLIFANNFLELLFTDPLFVFRLQYFHNHQIPLHVAESEISLFNHECAILAMRQELKNLRSDSEDLLRAFLLLMLAGLNRKYCQTYQLSPERRSNQEAYAFKKLLEQRIRTHQRVEDYAEELKVSRVTLNKIVKNQFGITAVQLIKQRLLTEVKRELLFTNKTISEIAYELNFSEPNHLMRFFKKQTQQTISEFKRVYS